MDEQYTAAPVGTVWEARYVEPDDEVTGREWNRLLLTAQTLAQRLADAEESEDDLALQRAVLKEQHHIDVEAALDRITAAEARLADAERERDAARQKFDNLWERKRAAVARAKRAEAKVADVTEKWVHMSNRYMEVYIEKERAEAALRAWLEWYDSGYRGHQPARLALDSRTALTPTEEPEHGTR